MVSGCNQSDVILHFETRFHRCRLVAGGWSVIKLGGGGVLKIRV